MKSIFVLSILCICLSAFANEPKVGDQAVLNGKYQGEVIALKLELTAYDADANSYTQTLTISNNGQTSSQSETVKNEDLSSSETLQYVVDNCSQFDGTPETITVPAGTFATCKMNEDDDTVVNIGVVPFGVVKVIAKDGSYVLVSYKYGQK